MSWELLPPVIVAPWGFDQSTCMEYSERCELSTAFTPPMKNSSSPTGGLTGESRSAGSRLKSPPPGDRQTDSAELSPTSILVRLNAQTSAMEPNLLTVSK